MIFTLSKKTKTKQITEQNKKQQHKTKPKITKTKNITKTTKQKTNKTN